MQLFKSIDLVEKHHTCNTEHRAEFASVHNQDSGDLLTVRFRDSLKANELYSWDLLDEMESM
jgi:hypothetical protein